MPELSPPEDEVAKYLIKYHRGELMPSQNSPDVDIKSEVHYNHYGNKGAVDLFVHDTTTGSNHYYIYEIKSGAAIREATGANQILRQYNRMRQYFFQGKDIQPGNGAWITFQLVFTPSEKTIKHLLDNYSMYETVMEKESESDPVRNSDVSICPSECFFGEAPLIPISAKGGSESLNPDRNEVWNTILLYDRKLAAVTYSTISGSHGPLRKEHKYQKYALGEILERNDFRLNCLVPQCVHSGESYEIQEQYSHEKIMSILRTIVDTEGISYNEAGLEYVAGYAGKDIRMGVRALRLIVNAGKEVTMNGSYSTLGDRDSLGYFRPHTLHTQYISHNVTDYLQPGVEFDLESIVGFPEYGTYVTIKVEPSGESMGEARFKIPVETLGVMLGVYNT